MVVQRNTHRGQHLPCSSRSVSVSVSVISTELLAFFFSSSSVSSSISGSNSPSPSHHLTAPNLSLPQLSLKNPLCLSSVCYNIVESLIRLCWCPLQLTFTKGLLFYNTSNLNHLSSKNVIPHVNKRA